MSLIDGLLWVALLQNVMQQEVFVAIRNDAAANATAPVGSGTWEDPFGGRENNPDWFDKTLDEQIQVGNTVRLGPGTFSTRGNNNTGGAAWTPKNNTRLIGSGMGVTTLKLVETAQQTRTAIGINYAFGPPLEGFEASDFTIDCGFSGAQGTACAGIAIFGTHLLLRRLRVINFGGKTGGALLAAINAAHSGSENCVVEDCVVENPSASNTDVFSFYFFGASASNPHRFCVIRNCTGRSQTSFEPPPQISDKFIGIVPGTGFGTILEGNQIANVSRGVYHGGVSESKDLVIWNNYFRNVFRGIEFMRTSGTVQRIIVTDNLIEVGTNLSGLSGPMGIYLQGTAGSGRFYDQVILRKNVIRDVTNPIGPTIAGIEAAQIKNLIVEENILNNTINDGMTYNAVKYANCDTAKFFNNQTGGGLLLRGYNGANYRLELEDTVQDVFLGL